MKIPLPNHSNCTCPNCCPEKYEIPVDGSAAHIKIATSPSYIGQLDDAYWLRYFAAAAMQGMIHTGAKDPVLRAIDCMSYAMALLDAIHAHEAEKNEEKRGEEMSSEPDILKEYGEMVIAIGRLRSENETMKEALESVASAVCESTVWSGPDHFNRFREICHHAAQDALRKVGELK